MTLQVAGFVVGCVLVAWCAARAFRDGGEGFAKLREADPALVALLLAATVVSIASSGATFWALVRQIRRLGMVEMQAVNLMASLFNYAPVRLGLVLRCAFHWRVERMPATELGAWIAAVAAVTLGTLGAGLAAGLAQVAIGRETPSLDILWFATYGACLLAGATVLALFGRLPLVARLLKGGERALGQPRALASSLLFRSVDLSMWSLRMWAAARIVGVELGPAQAALLASVAVLGAGNPLGRIGWREALVAVIAPLVVRGDDAGGSLEALTSQLALLESAGEAAVTIPLGLLGALWCARAVRRADAPRIPSAA
jgi:hypothetical protein